MAPSLVQSKSNTTATLTSLTVTLTSPTTAGNCLIVCVSGEAATTSPSTSGITLGGSAGNFAQVITAGNPSTDINTSAQWADPNCAGGQTSVVITLTGGSGAGSVNAVVMEWAGLLPSSPADKTASQVEDTAANAWSSTATATTTQASEVAIGMVEANVTGGVTITGPVSPWVNLTQQNSGGGGDCLLAGYNILSSTGAQTYNGTFASSATAKYVSVIATYQAAPVNPASPAAPGQTWRRRFHHGQSAPVPAQPPAFTSPAAVQGSGTLSGAIVRKSAGVSGAEGSGELSGTLAKNITITSAIQATGELSGSAGLPVPVVTVTGSGSSAAQIGFYAPVQPGLESLQIPVSNVAGDWMAAIITWRQPAAGDEVTFSVADDVHNWWEPLGDPQGTGTSSASGVTRCAVWVAPAARAAGNVMINPSGFVMSCCATILDISGLEPWLTITAAVTTFANAATALSALTSGTPASAAVMITACGSDLNTATISLAGSGWTSLPAVTASNGSSHISDLTLTPAWQTSAASESATWSSNASLDMSGIVVAFLVDGTPLVQVNPVWPVVITEIAPGQGPGTPPDQIVWTQALSGRQWSWSFTQGAQYTLGQLQAGQGTLQADDPDGALIPPGAGSFAGLDSGTPWRQRIIWPPSPTPHNVAGAGFFQRWPPAWDPDTYRGMTTATITDIWGYANAQLNSILRTEILNDSPYAYWPCSDPSGSPSASNLATGNPNPLVVATSKYGIGTATADFGANTGGLLGDTQTTITASLRTSAGEGMFGQVQPATVAFTANFASPCTFTPADMTEFTANGQEVYIYISTGVGGFSDGSYFITGLTSSAFNLAATPGGAQLGSSSAGAGFLMTTLQTLQGAALTCTDSNYPPISAGVTIEAFFESTADFIYDNVIWAISGPGGRILQLFLQNATGYLCLNYWPLGAATPTTVVIYGAVFSDFLVISHVTVAFTQNTYTAYYDGGNVTVSGSFSSPIAASFDLFEGAGLSDRTQTGNWLTGYLSHAVIFPGLVPQVRILSHYLAGVFGFGEGSGDTPDARISRLLQAGAVTGRRAILHEPGGADSATCTSCQDIGGQPAATSLVNIAASTTPAVLTVAPTGDIVYFPRSYTYNQTVRWVLGDDTAAGEIPFLPAFAPDYDPVRVYNDIQITQLDDQSVNTPSGQAAGLEPPSRLAYGDITYQPTGYLLGDINSAYTFGAGLLDLANWIAATQNTPRMRIAAVTVAASANVASAGAGLAWPFLAGAACGDMITVNLRPATQGGALFTVTGRILQTARTMSYGQDTATASITCVIDVTPEADILTFDDPVRGLLNGQNRLGW